MLPGVRSRTVTTDRLRVQLIESGPEAGIPVLLIHGNLSTGRFFEHLLPGAPERYRFVAPDMRGFGDTEPLPIDATRGLRDWADDAYSVVRALGIDRPVHLAGWSTGGAAIAAYAGSGGGTAAPDFVEHLRSGDRTADSPFSPRNVINTAYWSPRHREPPDREDVLVDEVLKTQIGDGGYPGDMAPSPNWPGVAPGTSGLLNALSGKYCDWSGIVNLSPKPPILWTHGTDDIVVADGSAFDLATLGKSGAVPGWPGDDVCPPQPMVTQIRTVLERYRDAGGRVRMELFEGSGHGPMFDAAERWRTLFFEFLASVE